MTAREALPYRVAELESGLARGWSYYAATGKAVRDMVTIGREEAMQHARTGNLAVALGREHGLCALDADRVIGSMVTWTLATSAGYLHLFKMDRPAPGEVAGGGMRFLYDGHYVMAPGSIHPVTGDVYQWATGRSPDDVPLGVLPDLFVDALTASGERSEEISPRTPVPPSTSPDAEHDGTTERITSADQSTEPDYSGAPDTIGDEPAIDLDPNIATDRRNAQLLREIHGADYLYTHGGGFHVWDGARFRRDQGEMAMTELAFDVANRRLAHMQRLRDPDARKAALNAALKCESAKALAAMIHVARGPANVEPSQLDADPFLLNTPSGTVDLRTAELRPHRREDRMTMCTAVPFDPSAECPRFERFVTEVFGGDAALAAWVHLALGYATTGSAREHVVFICHGNGRNGKSTLIEAVRYALGDYAMDTPPGTFLEGRAEGSGPTADIARLRGARFVTTIETGEGNRLNMPVMKRASGGDMMTARFLYREHFEFKPVLKLFMATNHLPRIADTDDGAWRRIRLIPFEVSFRGREDRTLPETLQREAPGILKWLVEGAAAWHSAPDGLGNTGRVDRATQEYRSDSDTIGSFIEARCVTGSPEIYKVPAGSIYEAYRKWCRENGEEPQSQKRLGTALRERGFKQPAPGRVRWWKGIALSAEDCGDSGEDC